MQTILSFLGNLIQKTILAFFITLSVLTALLFPMLTLIGIAAAAGSKDIEQTSLNTRYVYGKEESTSKILTIPITGIIYGDSESDGDSGGLFGSSSNAYGYEIKKLLRKAATDTEIKGVIIEINSPGGTIYGSQAIADGIATYKERTKKPVYAHVTGLAASGGYWAAVGTDKIIADVGSTIGSIGVINGEFTFFNNPIAIDNGILGGGVTTKDGIESYYVTSGKGKDLGNPYRKPTEEELRIMQEGADNNYSLFVKRVSEHRGIDEQVIRSEIGAYVYDNEGAIARKLLDMTGSREVAYAEIAKKAGIENDYQVVTSQERRTKLESLLGAFGLSHTITAGSSIKNQVVSEMCVPNKPLVYFGDVRQICSK